MLCGQLLTTSTRFPDSARITCREAESLFRYLVMQCRPREAGGFGNDTLPAVAERFRLDRCPYPTTTLIQNARSALKLLPNLFDKLLTAHKKIVSQSTNLFNFFLDRPLAV